MQAKVGDSAPHEVPGAVCGGAEWSWLRVRWVGAVRPSVHPSVRPFVRPSVHHLSLRLPIHPAVRPVVRPSIRPSVRPSVRLSVRPSVRPSVCPSIHPSLLSSRRPFCPSGRPSVPSSLCTSVRPPVRPCLRPSLPSVFLSVRGRTGREGRGRTAWKGTVHEGLAHRRMDGRTKGWTDGRTDGQTDGLRTDGQTDRRTDRRTVGSLSSRLWPSWGSGSGLSAIRVSMLCGCPFVLRGIVEVHGSERRQRCFSSAGCGNLLQVTCTTAATSRPLPLAFLRCCSLGRDKASSCFLRPR